MNFWQQIAGYAAAIREFVAPTRQATKVQTPAETVPLVSASLEPVSLARKRTTPEAATSSR